MGKPARKLAIAEPPAPARARRSHGVVRLARNERAWVIETQPHIILRLKRLFAKVENQQHGSIIISDTDENARELLWFLDRYPMEVDPREHLEERARAHVERESIVEALVDGRHSGHPFELAVPAREYQKIAASMLLAGGSLLLADDVGLGKTASAICTLTDPRTLPAVVVTLAHLPRQWEIEIARFAPHLRTHVVKQTKHYDLRETPYGGRWVELPDVILISYSKLHAWADVLGPIARSVIFDEIQELRHERHGSDPSAKYAAAKFIAERAVYRMGLSATPIYNYGGEMFNVMNILHPGALGTRSEFVTEWCVREDDERKIRIRDPKAFGTYARDAGLMLRRTRAEVGRELPAIQKIPHHVDADLGQLEKIASSAAELARIILEKRESFRGQTRQASSDLLNKLRQTTGIAKAPFVADFVRLLVESGERVVLYGWHREFYSIVLDRLKDLNPRLYTGSETPQEKAAAKDAFVAGDCQVLIISLRAGAGLDGLQHVCRTVVFGELDWSPGVHEQCIGRVGRDGQKEPVAAYFLVAESGSDPILAELLQIKRQQAEGVRDPHAELVEELQVDEGLIPRLAEAYLKQRGLEVPAPKKKESTDV